MSKEGCPSPPFEARHLLKLSYYGNINRIRSSRRFEEECMRGCRALVADLQLTPGYHTIADFRKDNAAAYKKVFKQFVINMQTANKK